jgi:hypothetical protein
MRTLILSQIRECRVYLNELAGCFRSSTKIGHRTGPRKSALLAQALGKLAEAAGLPMVAKGEDPCGLSDDGKAPGD